jgi:CHAT domain-containing protein
LILSAPTAGAREDGVLHAYEIGRLDIRAGLVVLSACSTALGKAAGGEGLIGLTHAFMSAGAGSVLATLWRVDDRSMASLMTRFYRVLRIPGATATEALQKAQLQLIDSLPFSHPYFWAGVATFGDSR